MKVILRLDQAGMKQTIYTSERNLSDVMRELYEEKLNQCRRDEVEITEDETWCDKEDAQIVSNNWYISEFKIVDVVEVK